MGGPVRKYMLETYFYSELTVLATISIQNTVVRARLLVSSITHRVFLNEIVVLSLEVRQKIRARDVFSNQSSRFGQPFLFKTRWFVHGV